MFFFSSRRRHTRCLSDWSSDVCSSDLVPDETFGDESYRQIADLVEGTFGPTMRYEVDLVGAIPQEPSGKYRFCISKVARERSEERRVGKESRSGWSKQHKTYTEEC